MSQIKIGGSPFLLRHSSIVLFTKRPWTEYSDLVPWTMKRLLLSPMMAGIKDYVPLVGTLVWCFKSWLIKSLQRMSGKYYNTNEFTFLTFELFEHFCTLKLHNWFIFRKWITQSNNWTIFRCNQRCPVRGKLYCCQQSWWCNINQIHAY